MKLDKTTNTILMFIAVLTMLITAVMVNNEARRNVVSAEYHADMSLTGARLSDEVYATVKKVSERTTGDITDKEYSFMIYNTSPDAVSSWKALLRVPEGVTVDNTRNVELSSIGGDNLIFTPEYYNLTIKSYEAIEFGIVLHDTGDFEPQSMRFIGYKVQNASNNIASVIIIVLIVLWTVFIIGFLVTRFNIKNYKERQRNDMEIILQSMNTFISFIDAKDPYTRGHSRRVAMYAAELAKRMGLSEDEVQNVYYAGLLHDSGKISIPDAVLNKPGKLTDDERALIQNHTVAGGKMLKQMSSVRGIRETALYHHERYDGSGYPEGLRGESIPLYARIVGVADSYDAMSSNRVYRRHLNKDEIIEEIQKGSGTQFDPEVVKYMVDMINDGYVNVVKMETADSDETNSFHLTQSDIPGVHIGY